MRFSPTLPLALTLGLFALTGCDGLFTAPNPGDPSKGKHDQETQDVTDPAKPTRTFMYVLNGMAETIDEIDLKSMARTPDVLSTGKWPNQLFTLGVVTYVVNSGDNDVRKLDLRARKALDTITLANATNPTTLTAIGGELALVTNNYTGDLAFVNLATKTTEATLALGRGVPFGEPAIVGGKAYVGAVEASYGGPPDFTATYTFSGVHVVDLATRTIAKTISLDADANPGNASVDPSGKVWVGVKGGLVKIDPASDTVTATLDFGEIVNRVQYVGATKAYGKVNGGLIAFNPETGAITKPSASKIAVDVDAMGAFKIFNGVGYVSSFDKDTVTVVDLVTEAASGSPIAVGDGPQDLTFVTVEDQ